MGVLDTIKWWVWPTFPYNVLDVVFPNRVESYYEGVDEIRIASTRNNYVISVVPRESRSDSPGPITFVSSHDPWTVGSLVTPFYLFRKSVLLWAVAWFVVIYTVFMTVMNTVFTPPGVEVYVPGYGRIMIPEPGWSPDPMLMSFSILGIGFLVMYYVFNILRFMQPTIKYSVLLTIGAVSGTYYVVPAPEPLTVLRVPDFLRLLGHRFYHFQLEIVSTLSGMVNSLIRENEVLREQALSYDDSMSRIHQIDQMQKRFSAGQVIARFMMTRPLLFMLLTLGSFAIGVIVGLALGGGVGVEPVAANHTIHP